MEAILLLLFFGGCHIFHVQYARLVTPSHFFQHDIASVQYVPKRRQTYDASIPLALQLTVPLLPGFN